MCGCSAAWHSIVRYLQHVPRFSFPLALILSAVLASCGQQGCEAFPVCLDPAINNRNHEVQANARVDLADQQITLHPGETLTVPIRFDRHGLPEDLPISITGAFVLQGLENPHGSTPFFQTATGTVLFDSNGLTAQISSNPVVGNTAAVTLTAAPSTPLRYEYLQVGLQKQNTLYGSGGSLGLSITIQAP